MSGLNSTGRIVFALGIAAIGLLSLIFSDVASGLQPFPPVWTDHLGGVLTTGVVLLLPGIGILSTKTARVAALTLAAALFVWSLLIHAPIVIATPRNGTAWVRLFETFALAGAALVLAGTLGATRTSAQARQSDRLITFGRWCFGIALPVFAATHFIYADFVATIVPAWIPGRLFWAYFTGAAHLLAGLAIVSNIQARLAATLAGAMYGAWALILHVPRVITDTGNGQELANLFVAVALCGAAWVIAGSVGETDAAMAVIATGSRA